MSIKSISLRLVGVGPMLMHNSRLGDPLDPITKALAAITSKRLKTEADHMRIAELEFHGSLYLHHGAPCLPQKMIKAKRPRPRSGPKALRCCNSTVPRRPRSSGLRSVSGIAPSSRSAAAGRSQ